MIADVLPRNMTQSATKAGNKQPREPLGSKSIHDCMEEKQRLQHLVVVEPMHASKINASLMHLRLPPTHKH
jgi:hypothetical protein